MKGTSNGDTENGTGSEGSGGRGGGVCVCVLSAVGQAKSVYVIGNTETSSLLTYTVGDNELLLQHESNCSRQYAIDLAVDDSALGTFLFVTYEYCSFIQIIDAKRMVLIDDIALPQPAELAGIVYDSTRKKVYTVDRSSRRLYAFAWDARTLSLEPDFEPPYYIELEGIDPADRAVGIALDEAKGYLYVSDVTDTVKYYTVSDWRLAGSVQTSLAHILGIAIDPAEQILYFGSMREYGQAWNYLGRYDLAASDPNTAETHVAVGASICGIAVDEETGMVYATTFGEGTSGRADRVLMFCPYDPNAPAEPNLTLVWVSPALGSPAGIACAKSDYKPSGFWIEKRDDVTTHAVPGDMVTYSIAAHSTRGEQSNVVMTDILPYAADFVSASPSTGTYYPGQHIYVWEAVTLADPNAPGDPNVYVTITVRVNEGAEPLSRIVNKVIIESDTAYDTAQEVTEIGCWGGNVIYVDPRVQWQRISFFGLTVASGYNTGTSWENAYRDLNTALARAAQGCGSEIWVAEGVYNPGPAVTDTFTIPAGVSVYGGYRGGTLAPDDRNPDRYKTILSGKIDATHRNNTVVTMGNNSLLDGVAVTESSLFGQGIYGSGADFAINNCDIVNNLGYGLYTENCNVDIKLCNIRNNKADGIRHIGENKMLIMENVWVRQSGQHGVYCLNSTPIVINSILSESDMSNDGREGIRMINPSSQPILHNLTVAHNKSAGVALFGSTLPEIYNSIVYHNGGDALAGFSADQAAYYSIIEGCNAVNYNINADPEFSYFDPNNIRISYGSPAINSGNPYLDYSMQMDMDGRQRLLGAGVDRGAYEIDCEDGANSFDWNADGLVNLHEFNFFSKAWLAHDPNDPAWLADPNLIIPHLSEGWYEWKYRCNLDSTGDSAYQVDLVDLMVFLDSPWLWTACWVDLPETQQMMTGGDMLLMVGAEPMFFETQTVSEKTILEQKVELVLAIARLEEIWLNEPDIQQTISPADWQEFMEAVYQNLLGLQTEGIQIE